MKSLQGLAIAWQALCFAFITIFLPQILLPVGLVGSASGVALTAMAVLRGRSGWTESSLLDVWLMFFLLLISQAVGGTLEEYLPITLLQFVMVLFAVELLTAGSWYRSRPTESSRMAEPIVSESFLRRSLQQAFRRVSRSGLFFASCYLVSLLILYLSASLAISTPLLADISLYMVVVSVALALLILPREE